MQEKITVSITMQTYEPETLKVSKRNCIMEVTSGSWVRVGDTDSVIPSLLSDHKTKQKRKQFLSGLLVLAN